MEQVSNPNQVYSYQPRGRYIVGVILIIIGIVFFLDNLEIIPAEIRDYLLTWQMLLIGIGIVSLFSERSKYQGLILIGIGTFFLIPRFFDYDAFTFSKMFWPLLLIFIGSMLILKHRDRRQYNHHFSFSNESYEDKADMINEVTIFGGLKKIMQSKNFKGGRVTAIFGGSEIDLTQSQLAPGNYYIEITAVFGGTTLIVPSDWDVHVEVNSILGGFADKRRFNPNVTITDRKLFIKGVAIFGGGEIKSV